MVACPVEARRLEGDELEGEAPLFEKRGPLLPSKTLAGSRIELVGHQTAAMKRAHWQSQRREGRGQNNFFFQVSGVFSFSISSSMWYSNSSGPRDLIQSIIDRSPSSSETIAS